VHQQGERGGEGTLEWNASAGRESQPRPIDPPTHIGWKAKDEKRKQLRNTNQAQHSIKAKYSQEVHSSLIDSQAKYERVCYVNSKERKLQEEAKSMPP
jgi:hypothetical protein